MAITATFLNVLKVLCWFALIALSDEPWSDEFRFGPMASLAAVLNSRLILPILFKVEVDQFLRFI